MVSDCQFYLKIQQVIAKILTINSHINNFLTFYIYNLKILKRLYFIIIIVISEKFCERD